MIYGVGAAMGFTPQQVDVMSMWQFRAAVNGYVAANSPQTGAKLSEEEANELFDWIGTPEFVSVVSTQTYTFDDNGRLAPAGVVSFTPR